MKRTPKGLKATQLRIVLCILLLIGVSISIAIFYLGSNHLRGIATEISGLVSEAQNSQSRIQDLQQTEAVLEEHALVIERAEQIVAESQSYRYQDQIVTDLNAYARQSGLSIIAINFDSADAQPQSQATPTPEGEQPAAPATGTSSLRTTSASITLDSPLNYSNFLRFIGTIEQNLTKMQVKNINLSIAENEQVSSDSLVIEVYIR